MAVLELIVRGVLLVDSQERSRRYVTMQLTGVQANLDPPLAAVASSLGTGPMNLRSLEHELSLTWPTPLAYVSAEVVPLLCEAGLMGFEDRRRGLGWLGPKLALTDLGHDARAGLENQLATFVGPFAGWVRTDPARAAALVAETGAAALLAPAAWRDVRTLYTRLPAPAVGALGLGVYPAVGATALHPDFDFRLVGDALDGWAQGGGGFGNGGGGWGGGGGDGGGCGGDGGGGGGGC